MHRVWVCPQMVSVFLWVCTCNARLLMLWKYWTMILPKLMRWAVNDYLPKNFGFDSRKCSTVGCKGIAIPKYRTNFFHDAIVRFSAYLYFHIFSYIFQVTNYILVVAIMFFFKENLVRKITTRTCYPMQWRSGVHVSLAQMKEMVGSRSGGDGSPPRFFLGFKNLM